MKTKYDPNQFNKIPSSIIYVDEHGEKHEWPLNKETLDKFGMERWTEVILPSATKKYSFSISEYWKFTYLVQLSYETGRKLGITRMPPPLVGFELIAIEPIGIGEFIFCGGQEVSKNELEDHYSGDYHMSIETCGNKARFVSHAFDAETMKNTFVLSSEISEQVATVNFDVKLTSLGNQTIFFLAARRDITPGERIYYEYFNTYNTSWKIHLFDNKGAIIPSHLYGRKDAVARLYQIDKNVCIPLVRIVKEDCYTICTGYDINYDIVIRYNFFLEWEKKHNISLLDNLENHIEFPPLEESFIKRVKKGSAREKMKNTLNMMLNTLSLIINTGDNSEIRAHIPTFETDRTVKKRCEDATDKIDSTTILSQLVAPEEFYLTLTVPVQFMYTIALKLCAAGLREHKDFLMESNEEKATIAVSESALFKRSYSTVEYYIEVAQSIYSPSQNMGEWKGQVENGVPAIWLELKDDDDAKNILQQLKQHIIKRTHNNIEIVVTLNTINKIWTLKIPSGFKIAEQKIAPFVPCALSEQKSVRAMIQMGFNSISNIAETDSASSSFSPACRIM